MVDGPDGEPVMPTIRIQNKAATRIKKVRQLRVTANPFGLATLLPLAPGAIQSSMNKELLMGGSDEYDA